MKIFLIPLLILIVLPPLTGCIQVDTLIKVNPDGSGVIEETFLMKKAFVQQIKAMTEQFTKQMEQQITEVQQEEETMQSKETQKKPESFDIFNEKELRERANKLGEGVTYLSGSKIVTDEYEGYKAIYAFKDIQKIRINQNPGEKVPSAPQQGGTDTKAKKEYITFVYTKGKPSELLIKLPADKTKKKSDDVSEDRKAAPTDEQQSEKMTAQMKQIFEGMKISFSVEVKGTILETNATHREGSRVTLMELDFGKLIELAEQFKKFSMAQPETLEETKLFLKDIPGIKVELNNEIIIKFQ
jgi:polyhydroxyalkanoate synthesis regulator phasin